MAMCTFFRADRFIFMNIVFHLRVVLRSPLVISTLYSVCAGVGNSSLLENRTPRLCMQLTDLLNFLTSLDRIRRCPSSQRRRGAERLFDDFCSGATYCPREPM